MCQKSCVFVVGMPFFSSSLAFGAASTASQPRANAEKSEAVRSRFVFSPEERNKMHVGKSSLHLLD